MMDLRVLIILFLFSVFVDASELVNQSSHHLVAELNASSGYNTVFTFNDLSFTHMRLSSTYILLDNTIVSLKPRDGSRVTSFIYQVVDNKTINASSTSVTDWQVGGFVSNANVSVYENDIFYNTYISSGSGVVSFNNTPQGEYVFWLGVTSTTTTTASTTSTTASTSTTLGGGGGGGGGDS